MLEVCKGWVKGPSPEPAAQRQGCAVTGRSDADKKSLSAAAVDQSASARLKLFPRHLFDGDALRAEIFDDLAALCISKGYIHAIAIFCFSRVCTVRFEG